MARLGRVAFLLGTYAEGEALESQALEVQRRVLGLEHPDTVSSMLVLALAYQSKGRYADAESLCVQILEIRKRVLGPEHPNTLSSMHALATIYEDEGKYHSCPNYDLKTDAKKG
jgi:hypothetical protein